MAEISRLSTRNSKSISRQQYLQKSAPSTRDAGGEPLAPKTNSSASDLMLRALLQVDQSEDSVQLRQQPSRNYIPKHSPQQLSQYRPRPRKEMSEKSPLPQVTYSQLMMQKQQKLRYLFTQSSSRSSEMLNIQRAVEETLRTNSVNGTASLQQKLASKHTTTSKSRPRKLFEPKEPGRQKPQRSLYSNSRSRERTTNGGDPGDKQRMFNIVVPATQQTHQTVAVSKDSFENDGSQELVTLKEISDVLGSKIDIIQTQIANIKAHPQQQSKLLRHQSQKDIKGAPKKPVSLQTTGQQTDFTDLIHLKDEKIAKLTTQLAIQMRDFQSHEKKLEKKHAQEKELLIYKLSPQKVPKQMEPQNELIKQLSTQLRDSTVVIKTQQGQINGLKLQVAQRRLTIETDEDVCELKAQLMSAQHLNEELRQQIVAVPVYSDFVRDDDPSHEEVTSVRVQELEQRLVGVATELATSRHQFTQEVKVERTQHDETKLQLDLMQEQYNGLVEKHAMQASEYEAQLDQAAEQIVQASQNEHALKLKYKDMKLKAAQALNSTVVASATVATPLAVIEHPNQMMLKLQQSFKQEFDTRLAEHAASHVLEQSTLLALAKTSQSELADQYELQLQTVQEELQKQQSELQEELTQHWTDRVKKAQQEVKQVNARKISSDSFYLLQTVNLQKEVAELRSTIHEMEQEQQQCMEQWKQIQADYRQQLAEAQNGQNAVHEHEELLAEKDEVLDKLYQDIEHHQQEMDEITHKLQESASEVEELELSKNELEGKLASFQQEALEQSSNHTHQIQELQTHISEVENHTQKLQDEKDQLTEHKQSLSLQYNDLKQVEQQVTDELQLVRGQLTSLTKQRDEQDVEVTRLHQLMAQQNESVQKDEKSQVGRLQAELTEAFEQQQKLKVVKNEAEDRLGQVMIKHESAIRQHLSQQEMSVKQLQELQQKLEASEHESHNLTLTLQQLKSESESQQTTLQAQLTDLQTRLQTSTETTESHCLKLKQLESERTDHLEQLDEYQEEVNAQQAQRKESDTKHKQSLGKLQDRISELESDLVDKARTISQMQSQSSEAQQQVQEYKQQLVIAGAGRKTLIEAVESHKSRVLELTGQVHQSQEQLQEHKAVLAQVQQERNVISQQHEEDRKQQEQSVEQAKSDLLACKTDSEKENDRLLNELCQLQASIVESERLLVNQKELAAQKVSESESLRQQLQEIQAEHAAELKQMEQSLNTMEEHYQEQSLVQSEDLQAQLDESQLKLQEHLATHDSHVDKLTQAHASEQSSFASAHKEQVEALKAQLSERGSDATQASEQLADRVHQLESKILEQADLISDQESDSPQVQQDLKDQIYLLEEQLISMGHQHKETLEAQQTQTSTETNQQVSALKAQLQESTHQSNKLKSELDSLQIKLSEKQAEIDCQAVEHKKEHDEMSEMALQEISTLEEQQNLTLQENDRLTQLLSQAESQVTYLQTQQISAAEQATKEHEAVMVKVQQQHEKDTVRLQEEHTLNVQQMLEESQTKHLGLVKELDLKQAELASVKQLYEDVKAQQASQQANQASQDISMQQMLHSLQDQISDRDTKLSSLQKQVSAQDAERGKHSKELGHAQMQVTMGQQVMHQLQDQMLQMENEKTKLTQSEAMSRTAVEKLTMQLAMLMSGAK